MCCRLDMSFNIVQLERHMQMTPSSSVPNHGNRICTHANVSSHGEFRIECESITQIYCSFAYLLCVFLNILYTVERSVDHQNVPRQWNSLELRTRNNVSNEMADSDVEGRREYFGMQAVNGLNGGLVVQSNDSGDGNARPCDESDGVNSCTENAAEVGVKQEVKMEADLLDLPMIQFDPTEYNARRACAGSHVLRSRAKSNQSQPNSSSSVQKQQSRNTVKPTKLKKYENDCHRKPYDNQCQQLRGRPKSTISWGNNETLFDCGRCMRLFSHEMEKTEHEQRCRKQRYECHRCNKFVTVNRLSMLDHSQTRCA